MVKADTLQRAWNALYDAREIAERAGDTESASIANDAMGRLILRMVAIDHATGMHDRMRPACHCEDGR